MAGIAGRLRRCACLVGSGDQLARETGIPRRTLETYLSGGAEIKVQRMAQIAQVSGVSMTWLATGNGRVLGTSWSSDLAREDMKRFYAMPIDDRELAEARAVVLEVVYELAVDLPTSLNDAIGSFVSLYRSGGARLPKGVSERVPEIDESAIRHWLALLREKGLSALGGHVSSPPRNAERELGDGEAMVKDAFMVWLDHYWEVAGERERIWLEVQLEKAFPEFSDWLKKRRPRSGRESAA